VKHSFIDIIEYYIRRNKIDYVPQMSAGKPLDPDVIVLVLNQKQHRMLNRMFSRLYDYTQELLQEQVVQKNMNKPPLEIFEVKEKSLAKIQVDSKGIFGELALPDHLPCKYGITFSKDKIPVVTKLLYSRSNVFGVINKNEFATDKLFSDVVLTLEEKKVILDSIYQLYIALTDNYEKMESTEDKEIARRLLLDFYYEQKQYVTTEFRIMDNHLERRIMGISLIPIQDGRFISVHVLKGEAERLGYIAYILPGEDIESVSENIILRLEPYSFDFEFCRRMVGLDRLQHISVIKQLRKDINKDEERPVPEIIQPKIHDSVKEIKVEKPLIPDKESNDKLDMHVTHEDNTSFVQVTSAVIPQHNKTIQRDTNFEDKEEQSPDKKLLSMIKKEFRIIRQRGDYKLSENILRNAAVISVENEPAVSFKNNSLWINMKDPFVESIMDCMEESPHNLYYLLSVIYSTINKELRDITDEDEMKFQMIMLDNLLEHPSLNSKIK
jgi:hypothetical protein